MGVVSSRFLLASEVCTGAALTGAGPTRDTLMLPRRAEPKNVPHDQTFYVVKPPVPSGSRPP
jgi:hypothetical protein